MGIARQYVEAADLVVSVWDGAITPEQWAQAVQGQIDDPDTAKGNRRLTDARTADVSNLDVTDVDSISARYEEIDVSDSVLKFAIVANEGWSKARLVESRLRAQGANTMVFNDVHAACAWLGVDTALALATINNLRHDLRRVSDD